MSMCCVPAPRRCNERVTAPNRNSVQHAAAPRRERAIDDESEPVAAFVVYALEIARSASSLEQFACMEEPRERRRAAG